MLIRMSVKNDALSSDILQLSEMNGLQNFPVFRENKAGFKSYWLEIMVVPNDRVVNTLTLFRAYGQAKEDWTLNQLLENCCQAKKLNFGHEKTVDFLDHEFNMCGQNSKITEGLFYAIISCDYKMKDGKGINLSFPLPAQTNLSLCWMVHRISKRLFEIHRPECFTALEYSHIVKPFFVIGSPIKKQKGLRKLIDQKDIDSVPTLGMSIVSFPSLSEPEEKSEVEEQKEVEEEQEGSIEQGKEMKPKANEETKTEPKEEQKTNQITRSLHQHDVQYLIAFLVFGFISLIISKIEIVEL
ncbi:unnamed protein product [Bursaphelenchus xylophilus]|uniref:(pine wood nematode) hypothetical protein n=1 Tax=Bursaphelenchus xylophilus TaxID=6326 RepID=A0A1I7SSQ9_BURXY|nr:unnamed protein product [Bursaphelenchus xylophilus]CAG9108914.1 unnamed protein product [Bursaphelenchus xylophilus]